MRLKLATVAVFTPWKSADATSLPSRACCSRCPRPMLAATAHSCHSRDSVLFPGSGKGWRMSLHLICLSLRLQSSPMFWHGEEGWELWISAKLTTLGHRSRGGPIRWPWNLEPLDSLSSESRGLWERGGSECSWEHNRDLPFYLPPWACAGSIWTRIDFKVKPSFVLI